MPPANNGQQQQVNNVWGKSALGKRTFLTFPSGQTGYATPIGLQGVMEAGLIGEADSLTAFVGREYVRKVRGAKGKPDGEELDTKLLMKSPDALKKIVKLVDAVVPLTMVEPVVLCHYEVLNPGTPEEDTRMIPQSERVPDGIYTDMIGIEDKMFLFHFAVSAVKDAESFREASQDALGDLADGEGVPDHTEQPARAKRRRPPRRR